MRMLVWTTIGLLCFSMFSMNAFCENSHLTKYAANPILDKGVTGSWDDLSVWAPTVLWRDGLYRMWYCGDRNDDSIRIGYATSSDGKSWVRFESNPVLDVGPSEWDSFQVSCPSVLFNGSQYCMWYSGDNGNSIGLATSIDGTSWTKYSGNPVFSQGRYPSVLFDGSLYRMWYEGYDYTTNYATSMDGISWTEYGSNPVLIHGSSGTWDGMYVSTPNVVFDGSQYIMSYSGYRDSMLSRTIGLAYSLDGISWSKDANNPVIDIGPSGAWDDTFVDHSTLLLVGSSMKMWYSGFDGTNIESSPYYYSRIGLATTTLQAIVLAPDTGFAATTIIGSGFSNNSKVTIMWDKTMVPSIPNPLTTDEAGNFAAMISIPTQTTPGIHIVNATDDSGNWASAIFTVVNMTGPQGPKGTLENKARKGRTEHKGHKVNQQIRSNFCL